LSPSSRRSQVNLPGAGQVSVGSNGNVTWSVTAQLQLDFWITATPATAAHGSLASLYHRYVDATGHAPVLPDFAAQFWQCRLRYRTSEEATSVAARYGKLNLSVGVFVIDFHNQRVDGDFEMNPDCYPDVPGLVTSVKQSTGAELMVSLWPNIHPTSYSYKTLQAAGCLTAGQSADPTSQQCRDLMWTKYIKPNYYNSGVKSFWLDETDFMKTGLSCGDADFCGRYW
jgi:alpha-D-xyloside xylohydrolase